MYYKRYELQWRVNLFFCTTILGGGAFGGVRSMTDRISGAELTTG